MLGTPGIRWRAARSSSRTRSSSASGGTRRLSHPPGATSPVPVWGTGSGFVTSRRLAEMMGGTLEIHSTVGAGTALSCFVTLPVGNPKDIPKEELPAHALPAGGFRPAPSVEQAERDGTLILLVEDHPINRTVRTHQLKQAGFALETAEDGEAGFVKWMDGRFALILTDRHMPRMDGYELTQAIRYDEGKRRIPRTPILALTANALQGEAERCLAVGMDDYLTKPMTIPALALKVPQCLPERRVPGPNARAVAEGADVPAAGDPGLDDRARCCTCRRRPWNTQTHALRRHLQLPVTPPSAPLGLQ